MVIKEKESKYIFTADRQDYKTPLPEIVNPIMGFASITEFDADRCCTDFNIPAKHYFSSFVDNPFNIYLSYETFDGLSEEWSGINWLNPPFDIADEFIKQAFLYACTLKTCEVWSIIPARTETKYWHNYILTNPDCFYVPLRKGLSFIDPATNDYCRGKDGKKAAYKNPLAIVYFGKNAEEYAKRWNQEQPLPYKAWRIAA